VLQRYLILPLLLTSCVRAGTESGSLLEVSGLVPEPAPLVAGLTEAAAGAVLRNNGKEPLLVIGALLTLERADGVTTATVDSGGITLEPGEASSLTFDLSFAPALVAGEELSVSLEVTARPVEGGAILTGRSGDPQRWLVSDGERLDAGVGLDLATGVDTGGQDAGPQPDASGAPLVVTTFQDELDGADTMDNVNQAGGAADLSLREAILIANNRVGPDSISFDPTVFPTAAPVTIDVDIAGGLGPLPEITGPGTAIDGYGAGVVLEGGGGQRELSTGLLIGADDVRVADISLHGFALTDGDISTCLKAMNSARLLVERCTVNCSGMTGGDGIGLYTANDAELLDNDVSANIDCVWVEGSGNVRIEGNAIHDCGYSGVSTSGVTAVSVTDNRIVRARDGVYLFNSSNTHVEGNTLENNNNSGVGVDDYSFGTMVVGNTIRNNVVDGVWACYMADPVDILGNVVTANGGAGISYDDLPSGHRFNLPVITGYSASVVSGTTDLEDGSQVEVFVDAEDEGELLVGSGIVSAGTFSVAVTIPGAPPGNNLTVTVTSPVDGTSPFSAPWTF